MFEYMIKEAISEYMRETGKSKREAIYKTHEIIKALGQECRREENPCLYCGFWDSEREGCSCSSLDKWYACPIEAEKPENKKKELEEMNGYCEDAVSREAMLKGLARIAKANARSDAQKSLIGRVMFFTDHLPTVTPKQRTGHWVEIGDKPYDTWECDNCGFVIDGSGCAYPEEYRNIYKYCPNCGAKIE